MVDRELQCFCSSGSCEVLLVCTIEIGASFSGRSTGLDLLISSNSSYVPSMREYLSLVSVPRSHIKFRGKILSGLEIPSWHPKELILLGGLSACLSPVSFRACQPLQIPSSAKEPYKISSNTSKPPVWCDQQRLHPETFAASAHCGNLLAEDCH